MKLRVFLLLLAGSVAVKTTAQPAPFHSVGFQGLYRPASITLPPDEAGETTQLQAEEGKADAQTRLAFRYLTGAGLPMDPTKASAGLSKRPAKTTSSPNMIWPGVTTRAPAFRGTSTQRSFCLKKPPGRATRRRSTSLAAS